MESDQSESAKQGKVTYRRCPVAEWTRPAFRHLSPEAKLVLLAARTCPASNMAGLVFCPTSLLAAFTGLPLERVAAAEAELSPGFLERDAETDELLVVGALAHQVAEVVEPSDKRTANIRGLLAGTHSVRLRQRWADLNRAIAPHIAASISPPDIPTEEVPQRAPQAPSEGASDGAPQAPSKPVAVAVAVTGTEASAGAGAAEGTAPSACAGSETGTGEAETHSDPDPPTAAQRPPAGAAVAAAAADDLPSEATLTGWRGPNGRIVVPTRAGTAPATT